MWKAYLNIGRGHKCILHNLHDKILNSYDRCNVKKILTLRERFVPCQIWKPFSIAAVALIHVKENCKIKFDTAAAAVAIQFWYLVSDILHQISFQVPTRLCENTKALKVPQSHKKVKRYKKHIYHKSHCFRTICKCVRKWRNVSPPKN